MKTNREDTVAVVMELGIHNCTLAIGIAFDPSLLNDTQAAIPSIIYVIAMYTSAGIVTYFFRRQNSKVLL